MPLVCICDVGYRWYGGPKKCGFDCKTISEATDAGDPTFCNCNTGFTWNPNTFTCDRVARLLQTQPNDNL